MKKRRVKVYRPSYLNIKIEQLSFYSNGDKQPYLIVKERKLLRKTIGRSV